MARKSIKNYTSKSPAENSIAKIERTLMEIGADRIVKDFNREKMVVEAIMFEISIGGKQVVFRLPAKVEACFKAFWDEVKRPQPDTKQRKWEQAERTAWKIVLDWVEAQAALIELEQAEFAEVFLPYAYNPALEQTLYQIANERGINNLLLSSNT